MYSRYSTLWMSRFLGIGLTAINPHPPVKQPGRLQVSQRCRSHPVFLLSGRGLLTHPGGLILKGADGYLVEAPIVAVHPFRPTVEDIKFNLGRRGLFHLFLDERWESFKIPDFITRHLVHQIACPFDIAVQVVSGVNPFEHILIIGGINISHISHHLEWAKGSNGSNRQTNER